MERKSRNFNFPRHIIGSHPRAEYIYEGGDLDLSWIEESDPMAIEASFIEAEVVYKQTGGRPRVYTSALGAEVHAIVRQRGGRPVIRWVTYRFGTWASFPSKLLPYACRAPPPWNALSCSRSTDTGSLLYRVASFVKFATRRDIYPGRVA